MRKFLVLLVASVIILASGMAYAGAIKAGSKDVTTPGTAVALLSTRTFAKNIIVKADLDNTGDIWIGDEDVLASTGVGVALDAGDVWVGDEHYLNRVFIDATVGGEGVGFTYKR